MAISDSDLIKDWAPACSEYFEEFRHGIWDNANQLQLILAEQDISIDVDRGDLIIGHAGVDGIYFCFRRGRRGVYAYYGIEDTHVFMAPDIKTLIAHWRDNTLRL